MMPPRLSIHTEDEVLPSPGKGKTSTPMFALAPAAMEEQAYFSGQNDDQPGISEVWHGEYPFPPERSMLTPSHC
jgi:hypothetical protein